MDPTRLAGKVIVPIMERPSIPEDVIPRLMGPTVSGGEAGSAHQEGQTEAPHGEPPNAAVNRKCKGKRVLQFELPDGAPSDEEVQSNAKDAFHAQWLLMKRDTQLVVEYHIEQLRNLKLKFGEESTTVPEPSQGELDAMSDPKFQEAVDEIVAKVLRDLPGGWDKVPPSHVSVKEGALGDDKAHDLSLGEEGGDKAPDVAVREEVRVCAEAKDQGAGVGAVMCDELDASDIIQNVVDEVKISEGIMDDKEQDQTCLSAFARELCNGVAKCSINLAEYSPKEGDIVFVSDYMVKHADMMKHLPPFVQEVIDYCFIFNDSPMKGIEEIFKASDLLFVPREDIWTVGSDQEIFQSVVDCWSVLLNENQKQGSSTPTKFFFSSVFSGSLMKILADQDNLDLQDEIQDCFKSIITDWNNVTLGSNIEMIFLPVLVDAHFVLFVVNINERQIQYLDNKLLLDKTYKERAFKLGVILADQVNSLLEYLNVQVPTDIGLYDVVEVKGEWKKGAFDLDCAVYVMVHMLMFDGSNEPEFPYLVDEDRRKVSRACICAFLVLSDLNKVRDELIKNVICFRAFRSKALKKISERRRKRAEEEEKRKKEEEDRKNDQDAKKKRAAELRKRRAAEKRKQKADEERKRNM